MCLSSYVAVASVIFYGGGLGLLVGEITWVWYMLNGNNVFPLILNKSNFLQTLNRVTSNDGQDR